MFGRALRAEVAAAVQGRLEAEGRLLASADACESAERRSQFLLGRVAELERANRDLRVRLAAVRLAFEVKAASCDVLTAQVMRDEAKLAEVLS